MDAAALHPSSLLPSLKTSIKPPKILLGSLSSIPCCKRSSWFALPNSAAHHSGCNHNGSLQVMRSGRNDIVVSLSTSSTTKYCVGRPSSQLNNDATSTWSVSNSNKYRPSSSDALVCQAQASGATAAGWRRTGSGDGTLQRGEDSHSKASLSVDSGQVNLRARKAFESNLAEVSSSKEVSSSQEETSDANDSQVIINGYAATSTSTLVLDREPVTGGAFDFRGATSPLSIQPLIATKKIVLVRHGLSAWNAEGRIQGSSDLSILSDEGILQAERCKQALANLQFHSCFASPISRARVFYFVLNFTLSLAKTSAEVIWSGRAEPLIFLDSLKEANLLFLEGMRNVDAKEQYPEVYRSWREDPMNFQINGVYPVVKLWAQAKDAWQEILSAEGELILVVTHKSILRALMCTALGMGPNRFRAMDINNGGISVFTVNTRGEPLLQCLNMTAHLHTEGVLY